MSALVPTLPVLVDEGVTPEFAPAVRALGERWTAPSGRRYRLAFTDGCLRVDLELDPDRLAAPPAGGDVDADLLELACAIQDAVGPPWGAEKLRRAAGGWGFPQGRPRSAPRE